MRTEVESLWSRDVKRLKQAIEHSLEAQRLAESVSAEHASEVARMKKKSKIVPLANSNK